MVVIWLCFTISSIYGMGLVPNLVEPIEMRLGFIVGPATITQTRQRQVGATGIMGTSERWAVDGPLANIPDFALPTNSQPPARGS